MKQTNRNPYGIPGFPALDERDIACGGSGILAAALFRAAKEYMPNARLMDISSRLQSAFGRALDA